MFVLPPVIGEILVTLKIIIYIESKNVCYLITICLDFSSCEFTRVDFFRYQLFCNTSQSTSIYPFLIEIENLIGKYSLKASIQHLYKTPHRDRVKHIIKLISKSDFGLSLPNIVFYLKLLISIFKSQIIVKSKISHFWLALFYFSI